MSELLSLQGEAVAVEIYHPTNPIADAILVHGFTGSKEDFDFMAPLLVERGYRVATLDNRGQNDSPHSDRADAYSINSLARDLIELSEKLGLKNPHILGHSLGGMVAQRAVVQAPQLFASLTLMCSGPSANPRPRVEPMREQLASTSTMQEMWELYMDQSLREHPRYELMKRRWLRSDKRSVETHAHELMTFTSVVPEIAATKIPTHVIYGAQDDAWPFEMQDQMAADLSAPVTVIADAGHCPNEDQPEMTADKVARFWASIN